ncbi:hypothetical protein [Propionivibrio soli]|uniref:hypothetical protein n=1 Tax=Propionivibrio soli TaxID=2976531 RepID=UPI0021E6EF40|nr:hypothetical protein [Propionivibrio soli]
MTSSDSAGENTPKWKKAGDSVTSPLENETRKEVFVQSNYGLTIGFEVNYPEYFKDDIQQIGGPGYPPPNDGDYGHAFFYLTKNGVVTCFFSFGPAGGGEEKRVSVPFTDIQTKDLNPIPMHARARPGDASYRISEPVTAFRLRLTQAQEESIRKEAERVRKKIESGEQKYTAWINDTCAETARDIIKKTLPDIPDGSGQIRVNGTLSRVHLVNPYMWHKNMNEKYKAVRKIFPNPILYENSDDPLSAFEFETIK